MNLKAFATAIFICLVAHQIEEYANRFWADFPLSPMSITFFISFNLTADVAMLLILILLWRNSKVAIRVSQIFVWLMTLNGMVHIIWAIASNSYRPGLATGIGFIAIHALAWIRWRGRIYSPAG